MENGVSSNLQSPGGAVRNSSGIFYVRKDLSSYTLSMVMSAIIPSLFRGKKVKTVWPLVLCYKTCKKALLIFLRWNSNFLSFNRTCLCRGYFTKDKNLCHFLEHSVRWRLNRGLFSANVQWASFIFKQARKKKKKKNAKSNESSYCRLT